MDMINKDKRRRLEMQRKVDYNGGWKLSYKYSSILMNKLDSVDLYTICCSVREEFLHELKVNCLPDNKNYTQVWLTMLNTVYDKKNKNNHGAAVRLLHQTNQQRTYNKFQ